ncbi:mevalonate kinase, partial [Streptococcus danieliae]|nr:mevalonate kinase [Streptococcus danieliae]
MVDRGVGQSHGKIILMGEHSVVCGYSAIALPLLGIEVVCRIQPASQMVTFDFEDSLSTAVFAALDSLDQLEAKISYEIDSKIPQKRGMGSSAAVSIAAIRAVYTYFEESLPS